MNIQEGIKELESHKMKSEDIRTDCFNNGLNAGIVVMKKLDEPQKLVVDSFVAEWFEDNKDALDLAIFMAIRELDDEEWPHKTDFENWLDVAKNKPIETLIRMKDGYEVEKESLYRVKLGEGYFVEYQGRGALIMIIPDDNKEIKIFDSKSDAERTAQTIGGTVEEVAEG
ncbi:DUF1642 domain-containing protein [Enterococcus hirae]|nr:DUF1642 domain-containing protein [Enterococcus hirae]EMF0226301.1 DUF1642 domain-containing protein [Enterococcus hirae]EMF0256984.1 DUF1642 domain-containing protein [Enterococcus hirae]EMF0445798.1 DUF1642 domain-containing protein [Enterococcus hirae]EMF0530865.1 DUF1642 domain-containing protein [Enterococcus hirae]